MDLEVGDKVRINLPDSWLNNKEGIIGALNVVSSDRICGHRIDEIEGGYSIVEPEHLEKIV